MKVGVGGGELGGEDGEEEKREGGTRPWLTSTQGLLVEYESRIQVLRVGRWMEGGGEVSWWEVDGMGGGRSLRTSPQGSLVEDESFIEVH